MEKRRDFLKKGMMAGGGLLLTSAGASAWMQQRTLNVGVIGTGSRGTGLIHLMRRLGNMEVVACADIIPFRLEKGLEAAGNARGYRSYDKLLENDAVEAVIVATPFSTHDEVAIAALEAGKHVYCEKTMVKGIPQIQAVVDRAVASDRIFQTGHQYHSSPLYNKVRDMILNGYLGDITAFECQWNRNGDWRRPVPDPKWERMINWRMYREYSGGLVAELCSHQIDFINWVTGSHPERITGFGGIDHWKDGRETYDNVHLLFNYPSGLDASFTCTTTNGFEDYQIRILGSRATVVLDYTRAMVYSEDREAAEKGLVDGVSGATLKAWSAGDGVPIDAPSNDPTLNALQQFYASVVDGAPVISDIRTGATTAKCVQMSLDAMHEDKIAYWNDYPELKFT